MNINATTTYHRTTKGGICLLVSNPVKITMFGILANNTISIDQSICFGGTAEELTGSTPTGEMANTPTVGR